MTLPTETHHSQDSSQTGTSNNQGRRAGIKVLAVDDSIHIRKFLTAILEREGIEIHCVPSGSEAMSLVERDRFDLMFIDIRMPGMNGYEALQAMRERSIATPAIAFSSDDSSQLADHDADFCDFLSKPIDRDRLIAVIKKHVAHRSSSLD